MDLYRVDYEYSGYLLHFDNRVPICTGEKKNRPFIGILMKLGDIVYLAPLTSPKTKHIRMRDGEDFIKIQGGEMGVINLNNMIPVPKQEMKKIEVEEIKNLRYANLLKKQLGWCEEHEEEIKAKAVQLYQKEIKENRAKETWCNFRLIEKKCCEYMEQISLQEEVWEYICA